MVQPVVTKEPIVLTKEQQKIIRFDLSDLEHEKIDAVVRLIENGTVVDAVIELKDYKRIPLGDAKAMVSKWIGDEHFAKGQSRQGLQGQKIENSHSPGDEQDQRR